MYLWNGKRNARHRFHLDQSRYLFLQLELPHSNPSTPTRELDALDVAKRLLHSPDRIADENHQPPMICKHYGVLQICGSTSSDSTQVQEYSAPTCQHRGEHETHSVRTEPYHRLEITIVPSPWRGTGRCGAVVSTPVEENDCFRQSCEQRTDSKSRLRQNKKENSQIASQRLCC